MKKYITASLLIVLLSCNSKKAVIAEANASEAVAAAKVIESHYKLKRDFKTAYIKSSARYKDDRQSQNVSAEIRIEKDKQILVSIRFLGITMAKALITPVQVRYYEKLGSKFFEGDYSALSRWLGTDLDFQKVQNMLIGGAMDDLAKGKYKAAVEDNLYKLEEAAGGNTKKYFYFEAANYLIKRQEISQSLQDRTLTVSYPSHKDYPQAVMPAEIKIEAYQKGKRTSIGIEYNSISFDENLTFPYSVPDGYERIYID
ncbi:MAG TPA: DUF4292 domain-containing protein [Flavobacterium sp.]|nr:DUF4292 domain-containing protein [Flavobacterium sp.]